MIEMKFHLNSKQFESIHFVGAIFTLVGTIIGAGILGIPYVFANAGFLTGMATIVVLAIFFIYLYLNLGEAILRTKGEHQLPGLAEKYLGEKGKLVLFFAMLMSTYGSLVAYILASGGAIFNLASGFFELQGIFANPLTYSTIFFLFLSFLIVKGLNVIEDSEILITGFLILSVLLIFVLSVSEVSTANLTTFNHSKLFLPYGAVFFAFMGFTAVPEAVRIMKRKQKCIPLVLTLAVLIPMAIYVIFSLSIVGVMGANTQELGTIGLEEIIGPGMLIIGNLFLLFSVATSFLAIGFAQETVFSLDYKSKKFTGWFISCGVPFLIFLAIRNKTGFVNILSISGAVFGGLMAILVALIAYKSKIKSEKKPIYHVPMNLPLLIIIIIFLFLGMLSLFI
ncbi:MAG: aromatic amino acid transport family protein [Nanoarchaeota archaeon]